VAVNNKTYTVPKLKTFLKGVVLTATEPDIDPKKVEDVVSLFEYMETKDVAFYKSLGAFQQWFTDDETQQRPLKRQKLAEASPEASGSND
jgi:hypothetical protein